MKRLREIDRNFALYVMCNWRDYELKKHLSEKLLSLDPLLSKLDDPEPTASSVKIPKAGSVKSNKKIKSIVKPTHILETAEITTIPVINQECPQEVSPIVSIEIENQVFETHDNFLEFFMTRHA